jgi:hypothetical protein
MRLHVNGNAPLQSTCILLAKLGKHEEARESSLTWLAHPGNDTG